MDMEILLTATSRKALARLLESIIDELKEGSEDIGKAETPDGDANWSLQYGEGGEDQEESEVDW